MDKKLHDEISKVAYDLYEKKGRKDGCHHDDWVEAEKIVKARYARAIEVKASKAVKSKAAAGAEAKETVPARKTPAKKGTARKVSAKKKAE